MTLIEALVVLAIIGALSVWGSLEFPKAVDRAMKRQARDVLLTIYAGEQTYFTLYNAYYDVDEASSASWETLYMEDPTSQDGSIAYTVSNVIGTGPSAKFEAKATCQKGVSNGENMTLNETQTFSGTW